MLDPSIPQQEYLTTWRQLESQFKQDYDPKSIPLWFDYSLIGRATQQASLALQEAGLAWSDSQGIHLGDNSSIKHPHILFKQVALCLKSVGLLRGWRNELLDVWNHQKISLGAIERVATRPLGLRTRAIHLHAKNPDGKIFLAKRALTKNTDPGKWDTLAGGLISYQESTHTALLRETEEEAGLKEEDLLELSPIRYILQVNRRLPEGFQTEDILYASCLLESDTKLKNQDGEVDDFACFTVQEAFSMIQKNQITLEASIVLLEDLKHMRTHK